MAFFKFIALQLAFVSWAVAADSLSYSGRLVNADGSPVSGPVTLVFDLVYTNAPAVAVCSKTVAGVTLVNGVFSRKLDFTSGECGGSSLLTIIEATPASESIAIKITDSTNSRVYAAQAVNAMPYSFMSDVAKTLVQMGATTGQILAWNGTQWAPASAGGSGIGTITNIATGTGLTGGPITATGTISIATGGVTTTQILDSTIANIDVSTTAAIARTKLASGTASHVLVNDGSGVMSSVAQVAVTQGGTGASSASGARTNLGLGTAAVANIGTGIGGVMGSDAVPNCLASQKLQMSVGPVYAWTCATDLTFTGGGVSSAIDMNSNKITELATPTVGTDAATKAYVDTQIAGVPSMQWDSVAGGHINFAGGRVGIGDTTPSEALDVAANARVAGDAQVEGKLRLKSTTANYVELSAPAGLAATRSFTLPSTLGANGEVLTTDGLGGLSWSAVSGGGGGSNWTLASGNVYRATGKVGIGMAPTTQALEVAGNISATFPWGDNYLTIAGTNVTTGTAAVQLSAGTGASERIGRAKTFLTEMQVGTTSDNGSIPLHLMTNAQRRVSIDVAGNVGIGTTSPGSALDVKGVIRLSGSTSGFVGFTPLAVAGSTTYTLPGADGSSGQVLTTNGSGVLSWAAGGGGSTSVGGDLSGTVSNAQIAANAVGTTEIANSSVTYAKTNFADGEIPAAKVNGLTTGLAGKEATITAGTSAQYYRGDKTMQTLNTAAVPESGNLYFLDSRVRAALMSGYAIGSALPIAATDTLLEALAKLEGSLAAVQASGQWTAGSGNVYRTSGNVGIGTASPSNMLSVVGSSSFVDTSIISPSNGLFELYNSTPAGIGEGAMMVFSADHSGGKTSRAAIKGGSEFISSNYGGFLAFYTNRQVSANTLNERMRLSSGGNLGIGTTSPTERLDVDGGALVRGNLTANTASHNGDIYIGNTANPGGSGRFAYLGWNDSALKARLATGGGYPLTFEVASTERMRIDSSGNVGIGTTAPGTKFVVSKNAATLPSTSSGIAQIAEVDGTSTRFFIDGFGNSTNLIFRRSNGTAASPTALLTSNVLGNISFWGYGATGYTSSFRAQVRADASEDWTDTAQGTHLVFATTAIGTTASSAKMRIEGNGNVAIGSTPAGSNTKLDVSGQIRSASGSTTSGAIDWVNGNSMTTSFDCGSSISFANLRDGGAYTLAVTGTGTTMCSFSTTTTGDDAATVTYRFMPANTVRTVSSHTLYSLQRIGTVVYVSWITGF